MGNYIALSSLGPEDFASVGTEWGSEDFRKKLQKKQFSSRRDVAVAASEDEKMAYGSCILEADEAVSKGQTNDRRLETIHLQLSSV